MKLREGEREEERATTQKDIHWVPFHCIDSMHYYLYVWLCVPECICVDCRAIMQHGKGFSLSDPLLHYDVFASFFLFFILYYNFL